MYTSLNHFITLCICSSIVLIFVSSQTLTIDICRFPYECTDRTIICYASEDHFAVFAWGYKSALQISLDYCILKCFGAFSCQLVQFLGILSNTDYLLYNKLYCYGTYACSNTTFIAYRSSDISCMGLNSCSFTNMEGTEGTTREWTSLYCDAYLSCAHSHISLLPEIYARGSYALYGSIIDTKDANANTSFTIHLSGAYAGYGAQLLCRAQHICDIWCNGDTSCYMLFIDCIGECHIYNTSETALLPTTNITKFATQNLYLYEFNNNEDCQHTNMTFDSYGIAFFNGTDFIGTDATICCRGYKACSAINGSISFESTISKAKVVCSGSHSCSYSQINMIVDNGLRSVFCEADASCSYSQIHGASVIHCMGQYSCKNATIMSSGTDLNVYFSGYASGNSAQIYCHATDSCNITCAGYLSCSITEAMCYGDCSVECDETWSLCPLIRTADPTNYPSQSPFAPIFTTLLDVTISTETYPECCESESDDRQSPFWSVFVACVATITLCVIIIIYRVRKEHNVAASNSETLIECQDIELEKSHNVATKEKKKETEAKFEEAEDQITVINANIVIKRERVYTESERKMHDVCDDTLAVERDAADAVTEGAKDEVTQFSEWLVTEVKLPQYFDLLVQNGYNSLDAIQTISDTKALKEMGISKKGHILKLMKEIKRLNVLVVNDNEAIEGEIRTTKGTTRRDTKKETTRKYTKKEGDASTAIIQADEITLTET